MVVGVMFTEISVDDQKAVPAVMLNRVNQILKDNLPVGKFNQVRISMHLFPEDWYHQTSPGDPVLYPDSLIASTPEERLLPLKESMDIVCSSPRAAAVGPRVLSGCAVRQAGIEGPDSVPARTCGAVWQTIHLPEIPLDVSKQRSPRFTANS